MDRWSGKVAVVTGASSGIGLATCQALVKNGMIVIGLARRKAKMQDGMKKVEGKGKFHALECDVGKEENVKSAFRKIQEMFKAIHVLVNNAGIMNIVYPLENIPTKLIHDTYNVNVFGLLYCSREAIRIMKLFKHEAHIINISSISGHPQTIPRNFFANIYPSTKRAVTGITETMQKELLGWKIRVTNISPAYVKTDLVDVPPDKRQGWDKVPGLEAEDVAESIVYILGTPHRVEISELIMRPLGDTIF